MNTASMDEKKSLSILAKTETKLLSTENSESLSELSSSAIIGIFQNYEAKSDQNLQRKRKFEDFGDIDDDVDSSNSSEAYKDLLNADYYDEEAEERILRDYDQISDNTASDSVGESQCQACMCTREEAIESKTDIERCKTCKKVYCGSCGLLECSVCDSHMCFDCKLQLFKDYICFKCLESIAQKNGFSLV